VRDTTVRIRNGESEAMAASKPNEIPDLDDDIRDAPAEVLVGLGQRGA
jgi:hypothetical protein